MIAAAPFQGQRRRIEAGDELDARIGAAQSGGRMDGVVDDQQLEIGARIQGIDQVELVLDVGVVLLDHDRHERDLRAIRHRTLFPGRPLTAHGSPRKLKVTPSPPSDDLTSPIYASSQGGAQTRPAAAGVAWRSGRSARRRPADAEVRRPHSGSRPALVQVRARRRRRLREVHVDFPEGRGLLSAVVPGDDGATKQSALEVVVLLGPGFENYGAIVIPGRTRRTGRGDALIDADSVTQIAAVGARRDAVRTGPDSDDGRRLMRITREMGRCAGTRRDGRSARRKRQVAAVGQNALA